MSLRNEARELIEAFATAQSQANGGKPSLVKPGDLRHQVDQAVLVAQRLGTSKAQILRDPVGTGKTAVALAAAGALLRTEKIDYVLVVAPNQIVARQWKVRAEEMFGEKIPVSDYQYKTGWRKRQVQIARSAKLGAIPHKKSPTPQRTLVIVDEAHRGTQNEDGDIYGRIEAAAKGAQILLVSATPFQLSTTGVKTMLKIGGGDFDSDPIEKLSKQLRDALSASGEGDSSLLKSQELIEAGRKAHKAISEHLVPLTGISLPDHPELVATNIKLGKWDLAYSVARVLPELAGTRSSSAYQLGLTSCSEAVWSGEWSKQLERLEAEGPDEIRDLLALLRERLGEGSHHPKVKATVDWVLGQVLGGNHAVIFVHWHKSAVVLKDALVAAGLSEGSVVQPGKGILPKRMVRTFRDPKASPVVLILTDRFSESIDLDGGDPALVHHDLTWNPMRLPQRWGRLVRLGTGFREVPPERIFVPVLDVEVDRRLWRVNKGRATIADRIIPADAVAEDKFETLANSGW